jgi:group I intron endonuclease
MVAVLVFLTTQEAPMPYKIEIQGIYKIINKKTNQCYVGQSSNIKKRLSEHFRLLRLKKHPNKHLQNAYNKYGSENFVGEVEIECESFEDMDMLENLFISGEACFEEAVVYNIADFAKAPMRGKKHTEEVRERIRLGRRATTFDYNDPDYLKRLSEAQLARYRRDPKFLARLKFIVENDHMTYAERGKLTGISTSSARKLFLKYAHLKGVL